MQVTAPGLLTGRATAIMAAWKTILSGQMDLMALGSN